MEAIAAGERLGRYETIRRLGRGASGEVWEAVLHGPYGFRRSVALKILSDAGTRKDATHEARLGAALSHPNVVATHDFGEEQGRSWLAMELVQGVSVADLVRRGPLGAPAIVDIGLQACAALAHVHAAGPDGAGLVHRDVKPSNLLVDRNGLVKLADLGVARLASVEGTVAGTLAYMAPEQHVGREDRRADLFSLGVTLATVALRSRVLRVGHQLQDALALERTLGESLGGRIDAVVPGLASVLYGALRAAPQDRYGDARAFGEALLALRHGLPDGPTLVQLLVTLRPELAGARVVDGTGSSRTRSTPGNLPRPRDRFLGRAEEVADLVREVADQPGVWSLIGPGGAGKTRLAVEVARTVAPRLAGGAWFVDLSDARSVDGVCQAVGSTLDVRVDGADPVARVRDALRGRGATVLVLDNYEQAVEPAARVVADWVAGAPELRVLVTTRVALRLERERRVPVGPLGTEDAVDLFVERAPRRPSPEERPLVEHLVTELEGHPLAIELAAARTRILTVEGVVARLGNRLKLLAGGHTDRPERQRSLRASLDGSWELLTGWQQDALAQLSVVEGGLALDAAEALLHLASEAPWAVDVVEALVDASLLQSTGARLRLPESVAAYAAERLSDEERQAAWARHGRWYAQFGSDDWLATLDGPDGTRRLAMLTADLDNLVSAMRRAIARGDRPTALGAGRAAATVLRLGGPLSACETVLGELLDLVPEAGTDRRWLVARRQAVRRELGGGAETLVDLRAAVEEARSSGSASERVALLGELGQACYELARLDEARAAYEEAAVLAERVGDRVAMAKVAGDQGTLAWAAGDVGQAELLFRAALETQRVHGNARAQGRMVGNLGLCALARGQVEEAIGHLREAVDLLRAGGDRRTALIATGNLGNALTESGSPAAGLAHLEEALAGYREMGAFRYVGVVVAQIGTVHLRRGDLARAEEALREALRVNRETGAVRSEAGALVNLAEVLALGGDLEDASSVALQGLETARRAGSLRFEVGAAESLAQIARAQDAMDEAERWLEVARQAARDHAELAAMVRLGMARVRQSQGRPREALEEARQALLGFVEGNRVERARTHALMAEVLLQLGRRSEAQAELQAAEDAARPYGPDSAVSETIRHLRATLEGDAGGY
ncbi:MAG: tetratricopeptide repeat protein [Alphaproteobacteria bacterium]|nr:tetratricopeptide repeat protein [Alphaproteobacteria bacterium]MCB9698622.1 tetratricopeptide repeat protein [Alphaproteobacteria bacterium]